MSNQITRDARELSSGTIANLIDSNLYEVIDEIQYSFVKFCEENSGEFRTWIQAWKAFEIDKLPNATDKKDLRDTRKDITKICECGNEMTVTLTRTGKASYDLHYKGFTRYGFDDSGICTCGKTYHFTRSINAWWGKTKQQEIKQ